VLKTEAQEEGITEQSSPYLLEVGTQLPVEECGSTYGGPGEGSPVLAVQVVHGAGHLLHEALHHLPVALPAQHEAQPNFLKIQFLAV
jgi:hypothetical protein